MIYLSETNINKIEANSFQNFCQEDLYLYAYKIKIIKKFHTHKRQKLWPNFENSFCYKVFHVDIIILLIFVIFCSPKAPLYDLTGSECVTLCCDWSDPKLIVSGGQDNTLRIYKSKH